MPIRITVLFAPRPRELRETTLELADGATVAQAVRASDILHGLSEPSCVHVSFGIWGHKASPEQVLCDGDRVELYRPLTVDPKLARRARFAAQGVRSAGLFARKRPGAKAGY